MLLMLVRGGVIRADTWSRRGQVLTRKATEEELQAKIEFLEMKEKASLKIKEQVCVVLL